MPDEWSRRQLLCGLAAGAVAASSSKAWAQAAAGPGQGLLARLQAAKKVTVGLANQPPFGGFDPDGTLTGLAPAIIQLIMPRLGIPEVRGIAGTFGELIPGLQADRWDFVAIMTITKLRCEQVLYSDPLLFDGGTFISLKGALPDPPKLMSDLVAQNLIVGVQTGGAHVRVALEAGVNPANIRQFPADVAIIDGLLAKRIQVALGSYSSLSNMSRQRGLDVDVTFPIVDDPSSGAACAFRLGDKDLQAAFQAELRAMKASGEYLPLAQKFGFNTPPDLMPVTADQLCATGK